MFSAVVILHTASCSSSESQTCVKAVVFHTSSLIHPKGVLEFKKKKKKRKLVSVQQCNFVFVFAKCIENVSRQDCPICLEVSYFAFGSGSCVGLGAVLWALLELNVSFLLSDTCLKTGHSHVPC